MRTCGHTPCSQPLGNDRRADAEYCDSTCQTRAKNARYQQRRREREAEKPALRTARLAKSRKVKPTRESLIGLPTREQIRVLGATSSELFKEVFLEGVAIGQEVNRMRQQALARQ